MCSIFTQNSLSSSSLSSFTEGGSGSHTPSPMASPYSSPSKIKSPIGQEGDRFISARNCSRDLFNNYATKEEIFQHTMHPSYVDKMGDNYFQVEGSHENN